ncbi:hypothetical protein RKE25_02185 [Dyella sp. BiH032]|uniref:hypothetical protein n=1 Tax=Dyella sp. BiH032 TaxID=3075430 RepID=UPI00289371E8|nr:hypothetical protein [Dyella sp. BiH032]WNL46466.1 hypothetical protein RKE25_02185 [Dyella sp. BiH032]
MDASYISAFAGLTGAAIGGLTSFATSWLTQQYQLTDKNRQAEWSKREQLFSAFIVEASKRYGDALSHEKDDVGDLVRLYALVGRIRLVASREVVTEAEKAMNLVIQAYLAPNRSLHELKELVDQGGVQFLMAFGEACRVELEWLAPRHKYAHQVGR